MGESSIPGIVEPAGSRNFFFPQSSSDPSRSPSVGSVFKDLLNDPAGFFVDQKVIPNVRILPVAEGSVGAGVFPSGKLGVKRGFDLAARVLRVPLVEQVLERYEIRQTFFRVFVFGDCNTEKDRCGSTENIS